MSGAPSKCLLWFNGQNFDHCIAYGALVVSLDIHHTSLRGERSRHKPFVLKSSKHERRTLTCLLEFTGTALTHRCRGRNFVPTKLRRKLRRCAPAHAGGRTSASCRPAAAGSRPAICPRYHSRACGHHKIRDEIVFLPFFVHHVVSCGDRIQTSYVSTILFGLCFGRSLCPC
jgi:hypothetical protein